MNKALSLMSDIKVKHVSVHLMVDLELWEQYAILEESKNSLF